ncbi:hypothetical protein HN652_07185 [archaeon]|nr:hypothetical protein [archaeon]MBT6868567.1 hypothetical protein [archaeon]MBT7380416.1 hypothetical protein [archaeon]MBT7508776.1 hypothetical protein [archaeon]
MVWSEEEIDLLKKEYPIRGDHTLSKIIPKSPNAIRIKASRLKIRKKSAIIRESLKLNDLVLPLF